jgi:putative glutamine amidotransferase
MYPDINRPTFNKKSLCFIEKDMANYISRDGVRVILIPDLIRKGERDAFLSNLDAFVFQGGNDIAPEMYGEKPISNGQWKGDRYRDEYELDILDYAMKNEKPVFGICRGFQLLNIYFGGSLFQDILTQREGSLTHRDPKLYDQLTHEIDVIDGSLLDKLCVSKRLHVNSVHHQAINVVADKLDVMAVCTEDEVIEALSYTGSPEGKVMGVQWHPEFFYNSSIPLFDTDILFKEFLSFINQ